MEVLAAVARGDPGYRGRYVMAKLSAARAALEYLIGKPTQPIEHKGSVTIEQLVLQSMSGTPDPGRDGG